MRFGSRRAFAMLAAPIGGSLAMCAGVVKSQSWPSMAVPTDATHRDDGSTEAILNYQQTGVEAVWTKRDLSGSDDALHGADWDQRHLVVKNGRHGTKLSLEASGFELLSDPKRQHVDYYDEASVIGRYYSECEELLKRVTGASFVRAFDHNVRSDSGRAAGRKLVGGNAVQGPASLVHGDYTADSAPRRFKLLGETPKLNDPLKKILGETPLIDQPTVDGALSGERRYAFINVWRPIQTVKTKPLACADAATVTADDLVVFKIVYADRVGENYFAKWRQAHEWFYFPSMTPDEVMLIKQWDSHGELAPGGPRKAGATGSAPERTSTFALHSAFADPNSAKDDPDRESIEVRLVLVF